MSYLVLARKYRPQTFEEVIDQEHITRTLTNAISSNRVAHANLFSGPRGTGKTTVARILAKAMNCEKGPTPVPCNQCRSCREITTGNAADVFEIDGASNNSVDQVRELRENIKYMPAHSPYKIYIIDEVHMLSLAAFNALLKTLEEPPEHILFMFATTEPHKIPITILSRCQRHDFKRITVEKISHQLNTICKQEAIDITEESLTLIAREADGGMRDSLSLLDQVITCTEGTISHDHILNILGVIDRKKIFDMARAILNGNITDILNELDDIYNSGKNLKKLYGDLLEHFRNLLVVKITGQSDKLVDVSADEISRMKEQTDGVSHTFLSQILDLLFREEASIRFALQPKLALEMLFIRLFQIKPVLSIDTLIEKIDLLRNEMDVPATAGSTQPADHADNNAGYQRHNENHREAVKEQKQAYSSEPPPVKANMPVKTAETGNLEDTWEKILGRIGKDFPSLSAYLENSRLINLSGNKIEVKLSGSSFNNNMMKREKNKNTLKKICGEFFGKKINLVITSEAVNKEEDQLKKKRADELKQKALNHPLVTDTIEIFNGKIVDVKIL